MIRDILHLTHTGTSDIETERLRLRRFVMGDANQMFREWAGDPNVTKYMRYSAHKSISETKTALMTWINDYLDISKYIWAVELKETGELIGSVSFGIQHETDRIADCGYCFGPRFWNKGYATEVLRAAMDYMFYDVNINRIEACHSINNPASGRVMQKAGMICEGRLRQGYMTGEGEYQDVDLYGLVKEDFEKPYRPEKPDFLDLPKSEVNLTQYNVCLDCTGYYDGSKFKHHVPAYEFNITEKNSGTILGEISLRLGFGEHFYFGGQIGYSVNVEFRNMGIATIACGIILDLARAHGFRKLIVTNEYTNKASQRVCEKNGAKLIRAAKLPKWHDLYNDGQRYVNIYEIIL